MDPIARPIVPLQPMPPDRVAARRASCRTCAARPHTICAALAETEIDRVALIKRPPRRLPAGATIYAEQEPCGECFTVLDGWVALTAALADGGRVVLDFMLPGDHFGFPSDPATPRGHGAIALTEVRLCALPRASMQPLLEADAALARHLAHLVALHEARGYDHLVANASLDAHGRVAHLLVELYFRCNHRLPRELGEMVALPLTLALIGEAVALSPEHVSRTLRRLHEEGVIRLRRGRLRICDPAALIRTAGVAERTLADAAPPVVHPALRRG